MQGVELWRRDWPVDQKPSKLPNDYEKPVRYGSGGGGGCGLSFLAFSLLLTHVPCRRRGVMVAAISRA